MFTNVRNNINKYFLGVLLFIIIIGGPLIMIIVIGILVVYLRNVEPEERSLDRILADPKLQYFAIASILSLLSLFVSRPMEYSLEMGFPFAFVIHYPLPQNSHADVHWTDIFSEWAINPLDFCINAGFYFIPIYLFTSVYKWYYKR